MRTVCTIYWDEENHLHHTIVSEVEENGSYTVISSDVWDNMLSFTWSHKEAVKRFGDANVRFYMVKEVKV